MLINIKCSLNDEIITINTINYIYISYDIYTQYTQYILVIQYYFREMGDIFMMPMHLNQKCINAFIDFPEKNQNFEQNNRHLL